MKKAFLFAAAATVALAGTAQAQICAGYPSSDRGFYFGGRADFPDGGDSFGVEAAYNASGPLSVFGGVNVVSVEDVDDSDTNIYRAGAAFEVASLGLMIGPQVSVCPVAEVNWASEDDVTLMQIPIGVGIGGSLGIPIGPSVSGYVVPALVVTRLDVPDDDPIFEDETETDFGVRGGVNVGFGLFTVGGEVQHVFVDEADPVFGIRVGIRL
ncbi:MAG TPA: hypothetical protein VEQ60_30995 [Longimicrobium sp.]|nr:hypothetical protein [Longimicrobium sp.]